MYGDDIEDEEDQNAKHRGDSDVSVTWVLVYGQVHGHKCRPERYCEEYDEGIPVVETFGHRWLLLLLLVHDELLLLTADGRCVGHLLL